MNGAAVGLDTLLAEVRACRVCAPHLALGPRPVLQAGSKARLLIVGQAPGRRVHATGVPFDDKSGDRLRAWLGLDRATFHDPGRVAILPMGFCYPGQEKGADLPPRPECAPLWHDRLLAFLPNVKLTLLVGRYAQDRYLGARTRGTLTQTVRAWRAYLPHLMPMPHPSWRNTGWLNRNPWFEHEALSALRALVRPLLS